MDTKEQIRAAVAAALNQLKAEKNIQAEKIQASALTLETPPDPKMGDIGIPLFSFAKIFRIAPPQISEGVVQILRGADSIECEIPDGNKVEIKISSLGEILNAGPYVNFKLNKASETFAILEKIAEQKESYGSLDAAGNMPLSGQRIMLEFSSPNTNKPLHLGHMRNDALGESVSRILKKAGAEVFKVNIINNRGIHICKSMLAYKMFHEAAGDTPSSLGMKGDHFVGKCYVEYDKASKEHPEENLQGKAEEMLVAWEKGDAEVRALWQKMNEWTLDGIKQTYGRTGVSFDKLYFESDTYLKGKDEIERGLEKGIFFKAQDGSVRVDITEAVGKGKDGEDHEKVLLRSDGTSVYITQDIGTAIARHNDWPFNQMIYVVATEQNFHFKTLFYILKKLGFEWAQKLYHLSYGLVNLPSGRMKSREGTVVDADDLIDNLHSAALEEIRQKGRDKDLADADDVAEKIALSALHYYLLQATPIKDMLFNPEESLSFNGNTGPYLQYVTARISSILEKAKAEGIEGEVSEEAAALLSGGDEWELAKQLGAFPETVCKAAQNFDPSLVAAFLYDTAKLFSKFYQNCPIVNAETKPLARARLALAQSTLAVMKSAMDLVLVPFLEKM